MAIGFYNNLWLCVVGTPFHYNDPLHQIKVWFILTTLQKEKVINPSKYLMRKINYKTKSIIKLVCAILFPSLSVESLSQFHSATHIYSQYRHTRLHIVVSTLNKLNVILFLFPINRRPWKMQSKKDLFLDILTKIEKKNVDCTDAPISLSFNQS